MANRSHSLGLSVLTVAPVWVIYPNLAPKPWKTTIMVGALLWAIAMVAMLWNYPRPPVALVVLSLIYPAFYAFLLWRLRRRC